VGVLLGVKKGLELCGSSSWSEEGPRIVREFFLACENLEQLPALLGVRTPYGVKSFWRVKMSPVMFESCNIFPES
jgi:hypothetical protein